MDTVKQRLRWWWQAMARRFKSTPDVVWVVGHTPDKDKRHWRLEGVYTDSTVALAACTTTDHFIGPALVNQPMADDQSWPGAYYPHAAEQAHVEAAASRITDLVRDQLRKAAARVL